MLSKECIVATIGRFVESRNAPTSQAWGLRPSRAQERSRELSVGPTPLMRPGTFPEGIRGAYAAIAPKATRGAYAPHASRHA